MITIKEPHLIQIGEIQRPLHEFKGLRLSNAVDMEYMGSSEFEFGALPKSFRVFEQYLNDWKVQLVDAIVDKKGRALRVFHFFNEEQFQVYLNYLHQLRKDELHTKERHYFAEKQPAYLPSFVDRYDFWWDITNNVMWSFDKNFMNRIQDHVRASLKYMNDKRNKS